MNRSLGHVLLWVGFLSAAFWSVYQLEIQDNKWGTIPWHWYGMSMAVGVAGIYVLRSTSKKRNLDAEKTDADFESIVTNLDVLIRGSEHLTKLAAQEDLAGIIHFIDEDMTEPFEQFAEARQALANRHGLQFFANVMTPFASAERYINRTWSAAADGYIDEVHDSLRLAGEYLDRARNVIRETEKRSPAAE